LTRIVEEESMRRESSHATGVVPAYRGLEWIDAGLPTASEAWPKFGSRAVIDAAGDDYDVARDDIREYADTKPWVWPDRTVCFLCDVHADADAFWRSLVASGGIAKTGPEDVDFDLTPIGRDAVFVIGGDCFDKGPSNLRLLRALRLLIDKGADVEILAGNHDLRTIVGLVYAGSKDPRLAHLFVRMGKKTVTLLKEVFDEYVNVPGCRRRYMSESRAKTLLYPDDDWYEKFPTVAAGLIPEKKLAKELVRIREKSAEFEDRCAAVGLTLGKVHATIEVCRDLFLDPAGEFSWFFERMKLARREGSFLFLHAGLDDEMAALLRRRGVPGLNECFRTLLEEDLFELYHGPVGNAFRTKYRDIDLPMTKAGVRDLHDCGIYAIVHGHQSIRRGQRAVMRRGLLNFECDASVDCNTRALTGLAGPGGAVTVFEPAGRVLGISMDYPYVKVFDSATVLNVTTTVESDLTGCKVAGVG
jgi:hypothetical protein